MIDLLSVQCSKPFRQDSKMDRNGTILSGGAFGGDICRDPASGGQSDETVSFRKSAGGKAWFLQSARVSGRP